MIEYVDRIGLPVPDLVGWHTLPELERLLRNTTNPKAVKLRRGDNSAKGVFYPRSAAETIRMCEELIERYQLSPAALPNRSGAGGRGRAGVFPVCTGSELAGFIYTSPAARKTASGSTSTLRESRINPILEKIAYRLLDDLDGHGLAMVEFKYDPATGKPGLLRSTPDCGALSIWR